MFARAHHIKGFSRFTSHMVCGSALLALAASIAPVPAQAFTLDGVLSTGEAAAYTNEFDLTFELEGNGGKTVNGGSIRIGRDGSDGDIFMLVDVPIEITDVVYGDPASVDGIRAAMDDIGFPVASVKTG